MGGGVPRAMAGLARALCFLAGAAVATAETTTLSRIGSPEVAGAPPPNPRSSALWDRSRMPPPYGNGPPVPFNLPPGTFVGFQELKATDGEVAIPVEGSGVTVTVRSQVLLSMGMLKAVVLITVRTSDDLPRPSVNIKFLVLERLPSNRGSTDSNFTEDPLPTRSTEIELLANSNNNSQCGIYLPGDGWKRDDELEEDPVDTTTTSPWPTRMPWRSSFLRSDLTSTLSTTTLTTQSSEETSTAAATSELDNREMVCATFRIAVFEDIKTGIFETLECANLDLLQEEGLEAFVQGDWYNSPAAVIYFFLLAVFALMFVVACWLDARRTAWSDEYFLVPSWYLETPLVEQAEEVELGDASTYQKGNSADFSAKASKASKASRVSSSVSSAAVVPVNWLRQSSAARDAVDDVISRWFMYFSEVRDFVEGLWGEFHWNSDAAGQTGSSYSCVTRMAKAMMGSFVAIAARRQAGASLGICKDVVKFITTDKDLGLLLALRPGEKDDDKRLQAWRELHSLVLGRIDIHWQRCASWASVPSVAARIFFVASPFVAVYLNSQFWSSSLRVLFFVCELFGSWLVATVFFISSGEMRGKRKRGNCQVTAAGQLFGRLLVIALVSLFIASIPVALMACLHSRGFRKVDYEGSPAWRRQLRIWRCKDRLLWILGLLYIGCCAFFISLFLANVASKDLPSWALTGIISLVQDAFILPLFTALLVPAFATTTLSLVSKMTGKNRVELLQQRRKEMEEKINWRSVQHPREQPEVSSTQGQPAQQPEQKSNDQQTAQRPAQQPAVDGPEPPRDVDGHQPPRLSLQTVLSL